LPLARVSASGELPLQQGVHPHWADQLAALQAELSAVADSGWQGKTCINRHDWQQLKARLQPYTDWQAQQPNNLATKLEPVVLTACLDSNTLQQAFALIDADLAQQAEAEA
ncbi:hypothetical protein DVW31_15760, partial [Enterococcus faecium]|uniref:hypothetical protein n=1 Tax=Enterococcus faecium TaxID=1352 RepID=UPI00113734E2